MSSSLKLNRKHFINQYPPFNLISPVKVEDIFKKQDLLLYVHIPFCPNKCGYCYYKSVDLFDKQQVSKYLDYLMQEIELFSKTNDLERFQVRSLYFGGGTPTILSNTQYKALVDLLFSKFSFMENFEFCSEARPHPDTLNISKLELMKKLGVNRLSMGMQNLNNEILRLNKRDATLEFYEKAIQDARKCGHDYINIDIMSGMLGENWDNWNNIIDILIKWQPESIAFYKMELFYNTQLYKDIKQSNNFGNSLMSDDDEIKYIRHAHKRLIEEAGYEVINCLHLVKERKYQDVHYTSLWKGADMKGFGISAHSCYNNYIHQNTPLFKEYFNSIDSGELPIKRAYKLSIRDRMSEAIVYGLKNLSVSNEEFKNRFGFNIMDLYSDTVLDLVEKGVLEKIEDDIRIKPEYYVFADDICREFFLPEYKTMMLAQADRI